MKRIPDVIDCWYDSGSASFAQFHYPFENKEEFEKRFPYKILGWQEEFLERGLKQRTMATLDKTLVTDYWTKNKNEFQYLRDSLNLSAPR
jgi:hypothetical protein